MKIRKPLEKWSTALGLVVLAVGFISLGFLSFINSYPENAATGFFSETTYSIVGSSIGVLVGGTFLVAAILFAGRLRREKRSFGPQWHGRHG
jgi:formate-dependent nitrite reductase membrane component NrfD